MAADSKTWTRSVLAIARGAALAPALAAIAVAVAGIPARALENPSGAESGKPKPGAQTEPSPPAKPGLPAIRDLRFDEDWSVIADIDAGHPAWYSPSRLEALKFIPLTASESVWLSFGGQYRTRVEGWSDFNFGGPSTDDVFWLNRLRYHADVHLGPYLRVFAEGKSSFAFDRDLPGGRRVIDADELDLQNGFVDVTLPLGDLGSLTLRPGRQEMNQGLQRLISALDWVNTRRTFDGFSSILKVESWTVQAFWTQLVVVDKFGFNSPDAGTEFYGVYGSGRAFDLPTGVELYLLGLSRDASAVRAGFNGTAGGEDRFTFGGRSAGKLWASGFDADVEGAYQTGRVGGGGVDAFMVASQLGYTVAATTSPRVFAGFDYASGDGSASGGVQTFNQLFPLGHAFFGTIDAVGRQNIIDSSGGVSLKPLADVTVGVDGHYFWRADENDALYNAAGAVQRGPLDSSSDVGAEVDLTLRYACTRSVAFLFGYSHFFPGLFIRRSGTGDDIDFVYAQMTLTF